MTPTWDPTFDRVLRDALPTAVDGLTADTDLKAAGLDSLLTIELLLTLETEFDISVPDEELTGATFATPASLWAVVSAARAATAA